MSYKQRELLTLRDQFRSTLVVFCVNSVAHISNFLCCVFVLVIVQCLVCKLLPLLLDCPFLIVLSVVATFIYNVCVAISRNHNVNPHPNSCFCYLCPRIYQPLDAIYIQLHYTSIWNAKVSDRLSAPRHCAITSISEINLTLLSTCKFNSYYTFKEFNIVMFINHL